MGGACNGDHRGVHLALQVDHQLVALRLLKSGARRYALPLLLHGDLGPVEHEPRLDLDRDAAERLRAGNAAAADDVGLASSRHAADRTPAERRSAESDEEGPGGEPNARGAATRPAPLRIYETAPQLASGSSGRVLNDQHRRRCAR